MPAYNGNQIYLSIDGVEVQAEFKRVQIEPKISSVDVTRGAGTEHMQRATGLSDTSFSVTVGYQTHKIQQQIAYMRPGVKQIVFGPEGDAPGKPKHVQDFILTGAPFEITVEKGEVAFELSFEGADAPVVDMFNGGVW